MKARSRSVGRNMTENSDEATLRALEATIVESAVDEVFVALPLDRSAALIKRIVRLCGEQGIIVRLHAEPFKLELTKTQVDIVDGVQVLTFGSGPHDDWQLIAKRIVDVLVSSVLLVILSPLFLLTSLLIKMDSRGPVLFKQERAGMNKRRFRVLKFRTMCQEAERLQGSLEQRTEADGPVFKVKDDPRVTGVGRVLRRCSIDELPQLINVLRGSMSLVGPRPLPMRDVMRISLAGHRRTI